MTTPIQGPDGRPRCQWSAAAPDPGPKGAGAQFLQIRDVVVEGAPGGGATAMAMRSPPGAVLSVCRKTVTLMASL